MSGKKTPQANRGASARSTQKAVAQARSSQRRSGLLFLGGAVVIVALLVVVIVVTTSSGTRHTDAAAPNLNTPPATTAVGLDTPPPWPAATDAAAAVRAAGLPMLTAEGTVEHIHAHLDVRVNGQPVEVPAYIGIDPARGSLSPLHTHDTGGVIHVESPIKRQFTLGELFSEWGVSLTADNIGALHTNNGNALRVYINGKLHTGNPAAVTMNAHDEIALTYGPPQPHESLPTSYTFPQGE
jgi:hypothetical protein